jgi:hypothetical protein
MCSFPNSLPASAFNVLEGSSDGEVFLNILYTATERFGTVFGSDSNGAQYTEVLPRNIRVDNSST